MRKFQRNLRPNGRRFHGSLVALCNNIRGNFKEVSLKFPRGCAAKFAGYDNLILSKTKKINLLVNSLAVD